jgi:DNA-binding response OmpR family regulator
MADHTPHTPQASVLVVEDEALIACDLQHLLESNGFRVIGPAASVATALDLIKAETPDIALLDVNLGGTTSFGLADALTARKCNVIFLTGHSRSWILKKHRALRLIEKPFLPSELLATVQREWEAAQGAMKRRSA